MKSKPKKGLIVIIILLSLALVGSGGYIIYDKVIKKEPAQKEEQKTPQKQEEDKITNLTEVEKTLLLDQASDYTKTFATSYPITDSTNLDNQTVLRFALMKTNMYGKEIMESDIEKVLEKYFGKTHSFKHEDIQCFQADGPLYTYDSATRKYTYQDIHGHGGDGAFRFTNYHLGGTVINEKIYKLKVNIIYEDYCSDICGPTQGYYKSPNKNNNRTDYLLGPYEDSHELTNQEYESIKEKLDITTFTFIKDENNNYGLKSVTLE